jgi:hypothetical protein
MTGLVPSTPTHYLETRHKNYLVPWNSHASMVGSVSFDSGFSLLTLDQEVPLNVQPQLIYSHSLDCTSVPWESLTLMVISLALVNGFINDR